MKIIYNKFIPFKGYAAINLFGVLFAREERRPLTPTQMRHERIHTAQMKELIYVGFYITYIVEYFFRWVAKPITGADPYRNISFEKEAYNEQGKLNYLSNRKHFAQWRK